MKSITLTESTDLTLELTEDQASELRRLGRRLRGRGRWWGAPDEDDAAESKSVIAVTRLDQERWKVRVRDCVGVVSVSGLQLVVQPKIPVSHLVFLLGRAGFVPRLDNLPGELERSNDLWELVAEWFTASAESLLRRDLIRDYRGEHEELAHVRGRVTPLATARTLYKGRVALSCEFEEFDEDNALNRVVRAAALAVAASPLLDRDLRRRARRLTLRMNGVGTLRSTDLGAAVDRRSGYYIDALLLARHILSPLGRTLLEGSEASWAFLIRTPDSVEAGLRSILAELLAPEVVLTKHGRALSPSSLTLNPDLVFDAGEAIGDIKYRMVDPDWRRSDLYQAVAFATGFRANAACVVGFRRIGGSSPPAIKVGPVRLVSLNWRAAAKLAPDESAKLLAEDVRAWLAHESSAVEPVAASG